MKEVSERTSIDPWFLDAIYHFIQMESALREKTKLSPRELKKAKQEGFTDEWIAFLTGQKQKDIRKQRWKNNIEPAYYSVDTCAGEFESKTPYYYSTYWGQREKTVQKHPKSVVLFGSGPNRIGQGIEFDYSSVRAIKAFKKMGCYTIMVNSNPETVSTDYDISDELYFEPLSEEHTLEILRYKDSRFLCIQFGGQTALELARPAVEEGFDILGSSLKTIDRAEDRLQFSKMCLKSGFKVPQADAADHLKSALKIAGKIGYPLICRPSYVLGGRRMQIIENQEELQSYFERYGHCISAENPCLIDQFLDDCLEIDVDMVRAKNWQVIGGILEHIEAAGIHSGDSMAVIPPQRLKPDLQKKIEECAIHLADRLGVIGLLNLQLAVKNDEIFILEANPRSSRSVPFLAKSTAIAIVDKAVQAMLESTPLMSESPSMQNPDWKNSPLVCVKGVVFPFKKFDDVDSILGPEMKSIGEVMGRAESYDLALFKALVSVYKAFPIKGEVFLSLRDKDKPKLLQEIKELLNMGYTLSATKGTARFLKSQGLECLAVKKVHEGRPHCVDRICSGKIAFVFNTTSGRRSIEASFGIRRSCIDHSILCITDKDVVKAFLPALKKSLEKSFDISKISSL